jgi:hypothetical protein
MRLIKARQRRTWSAKIITLLAALGLAGRGWGAETSNTTDPLLDLFIKKGFVTQQEAEQVEAEAQALRTNGTQMPQSPPSKWNISSGLKNVGLFGDVRLRYEDRSAADPAGNKIDLQRFRYAVRVGLQGDLYDQFYYGVRLDTGANPRSSYVTLGTSASGSSVYQGPFGKSNGGVNIGEAYLGWRPWDWLDLTAGKMPNPLFTTSMVWDGDFNPEGLAERFNYPVGPALFFANFGQFLYADLNPNSASGGLGINGLVGQNTGNIFMFAWQGGVDYHITTNISAKAAATLYTYAGLRQSSINSFSSLSPYFGDPYIGEGAYYLEGVGNAPGYGGYGLSSALPGYGSVNFPLNQVGLDHLTVVEVPFELNFKVSRLDARVFGDFAYNLDGSQRAKDAAAAYQAVQTAQINPVPQPHTITPQTGDVKAYQIGLDFGSRNSLGLVNGSTSRRHGWEVKTYWQHVEQYALDPNLLDSDFFEGRANLEGVYVAAAYGLTGNLTAVFRYGHASRINDLLGTGGSNQDIPWINPINSFDIFQFDLNFKF